jgi:hypothetical protein
MGSAIDALQNEAMVLIAEADAEIDRLRRDNERLRAALDIATDALTARGASMVLQLIDKALANEPEGE